MAFKRTTSKTFRAEVKVPVVNESGGYDQNTFTAIFKHADTEEQDALRKRVQEAPTVTAGQKLLVRDRLVGWEMTDDETKEAVPFTPENLEAILLIPPSPLHIGIAFWETVNGARAKNL